MFMHRWPGFLLFVLLYLHTASSLSQTSQSQPALSQHLKPSLGVAPDAEIINDWDITVFPDGTGLPDGSGNAERGSALYKLHCLSCHGPDGQGALAEELAGGEGTLTDRYPDKTIGLYWPYATTVFDVIRRSMPLHAPGSLSNNETYSLTAYLLSINGIIDSALTVDAKTLPEILMPNRHGFKSIDVNYKTAPADR